MSISAADVKALREKTGAGMMDCKKALAETNGDFDAAIELLRKKGQKVSEKRSDRDAKEGFVVTRVSEDGKTASALELNCETDFVARNEDFQAKATAFNNIMFENGITSLEELLAAPYENTTIGDEVSAMIGAIGEKIQINKAIFVQSEGQVIAYNHPGNSLGVLVEFDGEITSEEAAKDVAMQVAAMFPLAVNEDEVDASVVEKELEIAKEQLINEGKPAEIAEKAAVGKLRKFYEEKVLHNQKFVKDNGVTVKNYLKQNNMPLVKSFHRIQLGEN